MASADVSPLHSGKRIQALEQDVDRFLKACRSDWPRPIDYTNLIDAQYALNHLKQTKSLTARE